MPVAAELKVELEDLTTLKLISSAFTEASAVKLRKIRNLFENNRQFYEEISRLYHLVRLTGAVATPTRSMMPEESETISIAVTSNQRFYGNINVNIMRTFLSEIKKSNTEVMVLGTTGIDYMKSIGFNKPMQTFVFGTDFPNSLETSAFLDKTKHYETVLLYYPKFVTLISQTVSKVDISQAAETGEKINTEEIHILYEPEHKEILEFFQRQVRSLLFLRVMLEADLSRTAARLITMSAAEERSDELIRLKRLELRKFTMSFVNAQLLETFAGMTKWKKQ